MLRKSISLLYLTTAFAFSVPMVYPIDKTIEPNVPIESTNLVSPANVTVYPELELKRGWNLVGANSEMPLSEIISQVGVDNLLVIQGAKRVYKKEYPAFLNDFKKFEIGKGYWIKVGMKSTLNYPNRHQSGTIALKKGWNIIDPLSELSLNEILAQLGNSLEVIQGADKVYKKHSKDSLNNFTKFKAQEGYWVKVSRDSSLVF